MTTATMEHPLADLFVGAKEEMYWGFPQPPLKYPASWEEDGDEEGRARDKVVGRQQRRVKEMQKRLAAALAARGDDGVTVQCAPPVAIMPSKPQRTYACHRCGVEYSTPKKLAERVHQTSCAPLLAIMAERGVTVAKAAQVWGRRLAAEATKRRWREQPWALPNVSLETRRRAALAQWQDPAYRAKTLAATLASREKFHAAAEAYRVYRRQPEVRAQIAARGRAIWSDPVRRAEMMRKGALTRLANLKTQFEEEAHGRQVQTL